MSEYCINDVVSYADAFLRIGEIRDDPRAQNGLQVENSGRLTRIAAAVDACQATIDAAVHGGASLLVVHHGIFWDGAEPLTGRHGRRVRALVHGDVALYAVHLPLDVHPEVGNNWVLARELGLTGLSPLNGGEDHGVGVVGAIDVPRATLVSRLDSLLGTRSRLIAAGPERTRSVAVLTGAGAGRLATAHRFGVDTFVTGEVPHHAFFHAEEWGINLVLSGHYATETVGVKALAAHLSQRFNVPWGFVDHPTGL
ncbi:MAG TPA: Nif3-like dinuclear metal center hexameric protein [Gemmatimonadales bacterium]|nr:Nif3-like dinuclear metal center hexameric protein [Gemmatimonadales bacterium]